MTIKRFAAWLLAITLALPVVAQIPPLASALLAYPPIYSPRAYLGQITNTGPMIDASGVRVTLTGTAYTVPVGTDLVRFVQTTTIASQTVTLPTLLANGQAITDGFPIQFVNYSGSITALTFSPAIPGWTNGSSFPVNSGARVRWDATAAAWQREQ